mgnify:CR=1 FL=1
MVIVTEALSGDEMCESVSSLLTENVVNVSLSQRSWMSIFPKVFGLTSTIHPYLIVFFKEWTLILLHICIHFCISAPFYKQPLQWYVKSLKWLEILVKVTLRSVAGICTHKEDTINWPSFEHYIMSIFTHLVSCWCSKFALIMPTFGHHQFSSKFPVFLHYFVMMPAYCTHFWGITGHHLCIIQSFSYN